MSGTIPNSAALPVLCGSEGKRIQAMYVRSVDAPDRYAESLPVIRQVAQDADLIFDASAHKTGGHRHIRWAMTADCQIDVLNVLILRGMDSSLFVMKPALRMLGYDSPDRKYMIFAEADVMCGKGDVVNDDTAGPDNLSNHITGYARVDRRCWGAREVAHELVHMLGGVQLSAPNSSGGWHSLDEFDLMAHSDPPDYLLLVFPCIGISGAYRLDCGNDDYFHTSPEPDSYLATHWNVADSAFLDDSEMKVYLAMVTN